MDVAGPVAGAVNVAILSVYACCLHSQIHSDYKYLDIRMLGESTKCTFLFISQ